MQSIISNSVKIEQSTASACEPCSIFGFTIVKSRAAYTKEEIILRTHYYLPLRRFAEGLTQNTLTDKIPCTLAVCIGRKPNSLLLWNMDNATSSTIFSEMYVVLHLSTSEVDREFWSTDVGSVLFIAGHAARARRAGHIFVNREMEVKIMGHSPDLSHCNHISHDGSSCKQFVNKKSGLYCVRHIVKRFQSEKPLEKFREHSESLTQRVREHSVRNNPEPSALYERKRCRIESTPLGASHSSRTSNGREITPQNKSAIQSCAAATPKAQSFLSAFKVTNPPTKNDLQHSIRKATYEIVAGKLDQYSYKENLQQELESIKEIEVQAFLCRTCQKWYQNLSAACQAKGHRVEQKTTKKRFFRCASSKCQFLLLVLGIPKPDTTCPKCGIIQWIQVGAFSERSQSLQDKHS